MHNAAYHWPVLSHDKLFIR